MKDQVKLQEELREAFKKAKKDHELSHDELVQQIEYALDAVKYPATPGVIITDQKAYEDAKKNPAPPPPDRPKEGTKVEHKPAEHKHAEAKK